MSVVESFVSLVEVVSTFIAFLAICCLLASLQVALYLCTLSAFNSLITSQSSGRRVKDAFFFLQRGCAFAVDEHRSVGGSSRTGC